MSGENRLFLFRTALEINIRQMVLCVPEDEFVEAARPLNYRTKVVKKIYMAIQEKFLRKMLELIDELMSDECIIDGMNELAGLIEEAESRPKIHKPLWRPPGNVEEHLCPLKCIIWKKKAKVLEEYTFKFEKKNEELVKEIIKRRKSLKVVMNKMLTFNNVQYSILELEKNIEKCENQIIKILDENL